MTHEMKGRVMGKRKNRRDNQPNLSVVSRDSAKTEDSSEQAEFTRIENISDEDRFYAYIFMSDVIEPQIPPISGLVLGVLFRHSFGCRRNWCQISISKIEQRLGASTNTVRKHLNTLIEDGWVCVLSQSHREARTYGLRIPLEVDEE